MMVIGSWLIVARNVSTAAIMAFTDLRNTL